MTNPEPGVPLDERIDQSKTLRVYGTANMWCGQCGHDMRTSRHPKHGYVSACVHCNITVSIPAMRADAVIIPEELL